MATIPFHRCDGVIVKEMAGETVLYDEKSNQVHSLNITASLVWNLCDGKSHVEDMVKRVLSDFDVDEGTARRDVGKILLELKEKGLLKENV